MTGLQARSITVGLRTPLAQAAGFYAITLLLLTGLSLSAPALAARAADFTPLVGVLVMLLVVTREGYARQGWAQLALDRPGLRGWGPAVLLPLPVLALAFGGVWLTGVAAFVAPERGWADALLNLGASMVVTSVFALGEETGWRGYLLPRLLGLGTMRALLLTGFLHGLFHLPLMLLTPFYHSQGSRLIVVPLFLAELTAAGVFYGYLRLRYDSLWPVVLAHGAFNAYWHLCSSATASPSPLATEYLAGESGVLTLVTTAAVAVWLLRRLTAQEVPR